MEKKPLILGEGGFGQVRIAKVAGKECAVKHIASNKNGLVTIQDIDIGIKLDHINLMKIITFKINLVGIDIAMDLAISDLGDYIREHMGTITMQQKHEFINDIFNGINFLNSMDIYHCDIKPSNMLIFKYPEENRLILKLADYGISSRMGTVTYTCQTPDYSPPEMWRYYDRKLGSTYNNYAIQDLNKDKIQIWGYGCSIYFILTGKRFISSGGTKSKQILELEEFINKFNTPRSIIQGVNPAEYRDLLFATLNPLQKNRVSNINIIYNLLPIKTRLEPNGKILLQLRKVASISAYDYMNVIDLALEVCGDLNVDSQVLFCALDLFHRVYNDPFITDTSAIINNDVPLPLFIIFACIYLSLKLLRPSLAYIDIFDVEYVHYDTNNYGLPSKSLLALEIAIVDYCNGFISSYNNMFDIARGVKHIYANFDILADLDSYTSFVNNNKDKSDFEEGRKKKTPEEFAIKVSDLKDYYGH